MTDETMRDLISSHDAKLIDQGTVIQQLIISVDHLVTSQTETNEQLRDISKFLAKQAVFSSKLETMDRELVENFKRIHKRIDEVEVLQKSENGCNSVRLLTKDVESITRDMTRLVGVTEEHKIEIESLDKSNAKRLPNGAVVTVATVVLGYMVIFGTYVVQSINSLSSAYTKHDAQMNRNIQDIKYMSDHVLKVKSL